MINFQISDYLNARARVEIVAYNRLPLPDQSANAFSQFKSKNPLLGVMGSDESRVFMANYLRPVTTFLKEMNFGGALDRLNSILRKLDDLSLPIDLDEIRSHCKVLEEIMREAAQRARFYHYPAKKVELLDTIEKDWGSVFAKFRSVEPEVRVGVDLWALGHSAASVFHMCRAAEIALRVLAKERRLKVSANKPIDYETFGTVLTALKKESDRIHTMYPNTEKKQIAVEFYSTATGSLTHIKDKYRDQVAHVRRDYDEHEALSAINHVRELLTELAKHASEDMAGPIAWGLRKPVKKRKP